MPVRPAGDATSFIRGEQGYCHVDFARAGKKFSYVDLLSACVILPTTAKIAADRHGCAGRMSRTDSLVDGDHELRGGLRACQRNVPHP